MTQKIDYSALASRFEEKWCEECNDYKAINHFSKDTGKCRFVVCKTCGKRVDPVAHWRSGDCATVSAPIRAKKRRDAWKAANKGKMNGYSKKRARRVRGAIEAVGICEVCGERFDTTVAWLNHRRSAYCSKECRDKLVSSPDYEKYCPTCDEHKHNSEFAKNRSKWDGFSSECKECRKKKIKDRRERASRR